MHNSHDLILEMTLEDIQLYHRHHGTVPIIMQCWKHISTECESELQRLGELLHDGRSWNKLWSIYDSRLLGLNVNSASFFAMVGRHAPEHLQRLLGDRDLGRLTFDQYLDIAPHVDIVQHISVLRDVRVLAHLIRRGADLSNIDIPTRPVGDQQRRNYVMFRNLDRDACMISGYCIEHGITNEEIEVVMNYLDDDYIFAPSACERLLTILPDSSLFDEIIDRTLYLPEDDQEDDY